MSKLITVATLSQTYKGIDVLLDAVARCRQQGKLFTLSIVGTGRYQSELEQLAQTLGIAGQVQFTGAVPWGPRLMELLDSAEMFVLPSRVEVMPRALLEAMARALPVLATAVGAVPEVVPAACLSMPGNAEQLSEMLMRITEKPALLDAMSSMNLKIASHKTEDFVIPALQSFHRDCLAHFHQTPAASQLQPSAA